MIEGWCLKRTSVHPNCGFEQGIYDDDDDGDDDGDDGDDDDDDDGDDDDDDDDMMMMMMSVLVGYNVLITLS